MVIPWPLLLSISLALSCTHFASSQLVEEERQKEYEARNYKWPPQIIPDTPGWKKLMMRRFRQMEFQEDSNDRYNGYMNVVSSALLFLALWRLQCFTLLYDCSALRTKQSQPHCVSNNIITQALTLHRTLLKMVGDLQELRRYVMRRLTVWPCL